MGKSHFFDIKMAIQARTEFASALNQVCSERGIEPEVVIDSIKHAILAAYRKDYGEPEDIIVDLNPETGEVALTKNKKNITPSGFGRIAPPKPQKKHFFKKKKNQRKKKKPSHTFFTY